MVIQYIIIAIILVACLGYATFCIFRVWKNMRQCSDYQCAGCPFAEKCKKNQKKVEKKFGGTK